MKLRALSAIVLEFAVIFVVPHHALASVQASCLRPAPGSMAAQPEDLRSHNGVLQLQLTYRNFKADDGQEHYCYQYKDGSQAPTLRLRPGDLLVLRLKE